MITISRAFLVLFYSFYFSFFHPSSLTSSAPLSQQAQLDKSSFDKQANQSTKQSLNHLSSVGESLDLDHIKPDEVSLELWNELKPYFLPKKCSLCRRLDRLFTKTRALSSPDALIKAGFDSAKEGRFSHIIVTRHKYLPGYIFKLFLDPQMKVEWPQLLRRVQGARRLAETIKKTKLEEWFCVPKKWIYPLPKNAVKAKAGHLGKQFILVAKEIDILSKKQNYRKWQQEMTEEKLNALFFLLEEEGLADSAVAFNIPFCRDDKIAFIDLEHNLRWPVPHEKLLRYLSPNMGLYWQQLIERLIEGKR